MRFSKSNWNVPSTMLATVALILIAGVAGAIFDAFETIDPDSPNYDDSGGWVEAQGDEYSTGVIMFCKDLTNDFAIGCFSTHPDGVNMNPQQAKVDQKRRDNNAVAYISADLLGDIVENLFEEPLDCDRVQIKGKANDRTGRVESKCTLTKCEVPGELTVNQVISAMDCIEDSEHNGDLGKKVSTLRFDNNNQIKGNITSKGVFD